MSYISACINALKQWKSICTCFWDRPAYRTNDKICCTRLMIPSRCFSSTAAHIPITEFWFALGRFVFVIARMMVRNTGAFTSSSLRSLSQVKLHNSVGDWLRKMEFVVSVHMVISSFRMSIPILCKACLLVTGSFIHSMATAFLLLLATAFTMCLRLGVSAKVRGFLYPTWTCGENMQYIFIYSCKMRKFSTWHVLYIHKPTVTYIKH